MHPLLQRDVDVLRFARELAIDHWDIDDLLDRYQLRYDDFRLLFEFPRFAQLIASEEESWASAKNTHERVRLKSAALIESYLEQAAKELHDANQGLVAKTGLAKLIGSFAGLGVDESRGKGMASGSGFSITINLGADRKLSIDVGSGDEEVPTLESEGAVEIDAEPVALPPRMITRSVTEINADLG